MGLWTASQEARACALLRAQVQNPDVCSGRRARSATQSFATACVLFFPDVFLVIGCDGATQSPKGFFNFSKTVPTRKKRSKEDRKKGDSWWACFEGCFVRVPSLPFFPACLLAKRRRPRLCLFFSYFVIVCFLFFELFSSMDQHPAMSTQFHWVYCLFLSFFPPCAHRECTPREQEKKNGQVPERRSIRRAMPRSCVPRSRCHALSCLAQGIVKGKRHARYPCVLRGLGRLTLSIAFGCRPRRRS